MFPLESPQRGDSNEYTQYIIFNIKQKVNLIIPNLHLRVVIFQGLKNEFEIAMVNEPSVFEPLKFYCISKRRDFCDFLPASQYDVALQASENRLLKELLFDWYA